MNSQPTPSKVKAKAEPVDILVLHQLATTGMVIVLSIALYCLPLIK